MNAVSRMAGLAGVLCLVAVVLPRTLEAQFVGVSLGRVASTIDWQLPKPASPCDACVIDIAPNANRDSWAPALVLSTRPTHALGLTTELRYTLKGYETTEPTLNLHYLEVPALLRVGALSGAQSPVHPFAELGPALALRVHCDVEVNNTEDSCRNGAAFGQDWRIRQFDVSAMGGVGLAIRLQDDRVAIIGARLDWGLVNIGGGQGAASFNRSTLIYLTWLSPIRGSHR